MCIIAELEEKTLENRLTKQSHFILYGRKLEGDTREDTKMPIRQLSTICIHQL